MYCYQCSEAKGQKGCDKVGVCGKTNVQSNLQDLMIYTIQGISHLVCNSDLDVSKLNEVNKAVLSGMFMSITNANFDDEAIKKHIYKLIEIRDGIKKCESTYDCVNFIVKNDQELIDKANSLDVFHENKSDVESLKSMILFGLKGMCAYAKHAYNLEKSNNEIFSFMYRALNKMNDENATVDELIALTLETGKYGVDVMSLLDNANTTTYGNPEITNVSLETRNNPAILVSGHDLKDLAELLEQTKGTGVDVYTHSEMLPAHYYPFFKKYDNLVGNYGGAWHDQAEDFKSFNGAILFTTNCIVPYVNDEIKSRIFTTGEAGLMGCPHIEENSNGKKNFKDVIEKAKGLKAPENIEKGSIVGGFAHNQVMALADKVVEAVKSGAIKKFVVMAGCDGRYKTRSYYTDFAKELPEDSVILTAGCAKYRYNKLDLGDIGGIPRVLDAGQCNDSYSLAVIALKLKEVFGLDDINDLPIIYNIAWYEQKAVIVLLALLHLGVKNIKLGPVLPSFLSENVVNVLVENFGISGISTVKDDMDVFFA